MKKSTTKFGSFATSAAAIAVSIVLGAGATSMAGEDIAVANLPAPVTRAINQQFPNAEMIKAERETENGQVKYEVKIRTEGKEKEVEVSPEGKILEVEKD